MASSGKTAEKDILLVPCEKLTFAEGTDHCAGYCGGPLGSITGPNFGDCATGSEPQCAWSDGRRQPAIGRRVDDHEVASIVDPAMLSFSVE